MESKGGLFAWLKWNPHSFRFSQKRERRFVWSSKDVCCCSLRRVFMSLKLAVGCEKILTLKVAVSSNYGSTKKGSLGREATKQIYPYCRLVIIAIIMFYKLIYIYIYLRYTYIKSTEICERRLNILNKAFLEQTKFLDMISPVVCHCSWLVSAAKKRAVRDISYVIYVPSFLGSVYHHHRLNWDYPDISWCTFQVLTGFKTLKTVTFFPCIFSVDVLQNKNATTLEVIHFWHRQKSFGKAWAATCRNGF